MTTQAYTYKPDDLLQVPPLFSEEQLLEGDLARMRQQQADPYGERRALADAQLQNELLEKQGRL